MPVLEPPLEPTLSHNDDGLYYCRFIAAKIIATLVRSRI